MQRDDFITDNFVSISEPASKKIVGQVGGRLHNKKSLAPLYQKESNNLETIIYFLPNPTYTTPKPNNPTQTYSDITGRAFYMFPLREASSIAMSPLRHSDVDIGVSRVDCVWQVEKCSSKVAATPFSCYNRSKGGSSLLAVL